MKKYIPQEFESKWGFYWQNKKTYQMPQVSKKDKTFYSLYSFPYPSGAGLHVGHVEGMVANDIQARYYRMQGYKVVLPMGWDSFGLPAENYAIKTGIHPQDSTDEVIGIFKKQINQIGIGVDWNTEVGAHWPDYYRWTQWIFLQLYKKGLAYQKEAPVNWCPHCQTVLANEQVIKKMFSRRAPIQNKHDFFVSYLMGGDNISDNALRTLDIRIQEKKGKDRMLEIPVGSIHRYEKLVMQSLIPGYWNEYVGEDIIFLFKHADGTVERIRWDIDTESRIATLATEFMQDESMKKKNIQTWLFGNDFYARYPDLLYAIKQAFRHPQEVEIGVCERCDTEVEQKSMKQWFFSITYYANELDKDLESLDWPKSTKEQQRNWIGKSQGAEIEFMLVSISGVHQNLTNNNTTDVLSNQDGADHSPSLTVFTTRPDTIYGVTYMVLAPDHPLVPAITTAENKKQVEQYVESTKHKTELQRQQTDGKEKTGVFTGGYVIHPLTGEKIPVWIADYVLMSYGTGAIMAVPAHDERDFAFARTYNLPIRPVISPVIDHEEDLHSPEKTTILRNTLKEICTVAHKQKKEIALWGGWVAEIHVGFPYRDHEDIDMHIRKEDISWWKKQMEQMGFRVEAYPPEEEVNGEYTFVAKKDDIVVDVEAMDVDAKGYVIWLDGEEPRSSEKMYDEMYETKEWHGVPVTVMRKETVKWWFLTEGKSKQRWKDTFDLMMMGLQPYTGEGVVIQSPSPRVLDKFPNHVFDQHTPNSLHNLNTLTVDQAKEKVIAYLEEHKLGRRKTTYRLRDWLISRQRYWGAPIPIVYDPEGNPHPVDEKDLPVLLPYDVNFKPTGESPLTYSDEFHASAEERYGKGWRREVDTMDTFVDSSWYFFRHLDAQNKKKIFDSSLINTWLPTDLYMIGAEHIVLHLLYSRFFTKFFYEEGLTSFHEPFQRMRHMGIILGPDNRKMSKRWGNVINPTDVIAEYGADTLRVYEMFMGPLDQSKSWNVNAVQGSFRFLKRIWHLYVDGEVPQSLMYGDSFVESQLQKTIEKVTNDIEEMKFNTAIAACMEFINNWEAAKKKNNGEPVLSWDSMKAFLQIVAPFAPFITEELWQTVLGEKHSIHTSSWPQADESKRVEERVAIPVQVNGKVRVTVFLSREDTQDQQKVENCALQEEKIQKYVDGEEYKVIYVPGKILSFVLKK